jgi:hypothetical protein
MCTHQVFYICKVISEETLQKIYPLNEIHTLRRVLEKNSLENLLLKEVASDISLRTTTRATHGGLRGLDCRSVIHYIHGRDSYIVVCVRDV